MGGNYSQEHVQAMLRMTDYCWRHRRKFHIWTKRGGKLAMQGCYLCEQAEEDARKRSREKDGSHG